MSATARKLDDLSDRTIEMSRLIAAPRDLVFKAFGDPKHITNWWGPNGFSTTTHKMQFRVGGEWLFTMHGPDGTDYENRVRYTEIRSPEYMAYDHDGGDGGDAMHRFKAEIIFAAEAQKTRVTLRLICASVEQRESMAKFGAIEGGHQTLARLDDFLSKEGVAGPTPSQIEPFAISCEFEAPRELLFAAFTEPEHMKNWWGPKGFKVLKQKMDLRPGGTYHYGMESPTCEPMWGKFSYREISAPERIVLVNAFSNEAGDITHHPRMTDWPCEMLLTHLFEEVGKNRSRLTVSSVPINETAAERGTFDKGRPSMTGGWTGTFEKLAEYLDNANGKPAA